MYVPSHMFDIRQRLKIARCVKQESNSSSGEPVGRGSGRDQRWGKGEIGEGSGALQDAKDLNLHGSPCIEGAAGLQKGQRTQCRVLQRGWAWDRRQLQVSCRDDFNGCQRHG